MHEESGKERTRASPKESFRDSGTLRAGVGVGLPQRSPWLSTTGAVEGDWQADQAHAKL